MTGPVGDTCRTPLIRHAILVARIERSIYKVRNDVAPIGKLAGINFMEQSQLNHLGNHIVGGENDIIACRPRLEFGQQILIGSVSIVDDGDPIFCFIISQNLVINIVGPVIDT